MKTRVAAAVILVSGLVLFQGADLGRAEDVSAHTILLLEQEYALAKTSSSYFIFNFETATVSLKARGMVLKEWPAVKVRVWGRTGGVMTFPLARKTAYRAPQRKDITPDKEGEEEKPEAKSDDLDILELVKMPVNYTLDLSKDVRIKVRYRRSGFNRILDGIGRFFSRGIARSAKTVVRGIIGRPFTEVELDFDDEIAAKNIYWSFFEGQKCILFWPESK